jgi:hypothetical protein
MTDQELMLWALTRSWRCKPSVQGWVWQFNPPHGQHQLVRTENGAEVDNLPIIDDWMRNEIIAHRRALGLETEE